MGTIPLAPALDPVEGAQRLVWVVRGDETCGQMG